MQEVRSLIVQRLAGDSTLYPALVPGGIWDRPIKAGQGQGATPAAFWVDPQDPARLVRLRRCIYVADGGDVSGVGGPANIDGEVRNTYPRLYYYVDATASGKTALDQIDARCILMLHHWQTTLQGTGTAVTFRVLNMTETMDSEDFPGILFATRRLVGEFVRR